MISTGQLAIRARWSASGLRDIEVALQRPPVTQVFIGQTPQIVVKSLPLIYSLCAEAQRFVGQVALATAAGEPLAPSDHARLWIEMLHENFWRLLLDWPPALGLSAEKAAFIGWRAARHGARCRELTQHLLTTTLPELAEKCGKKWVDRSLSAESQASRVEPWRSPFLPQKFSENSPAEAEGNTDLFETVRAEPVEALENTGITLRQGCLPSSLPPASPRQAFESRLRAVHEAAAALYADQPYPLALAAAESCAVAQTATARGVLTHAVRLAAGRIENYRVWAPTDLFFADARALSALLAGQQFADTAAARQAIEQAVLALDPCLPYTVELSDA
ncbi:MAG: hypothetical protein CVU16_13705 [Betaproteobacteria bacterium HGW-Betaproteobacteria-10]|nr:MAG: hypothetical protein CVU16_13705 [Betaproteobacteria bacterium HGW-Betaproteobacteria-10]